VLRQEPVYGERGDEAIPPRYEREIASSQKPLLAMTVTIRVHPGASRWVTSNDPTVFYFKN
jgi:hypothetical protein